MNPLLYITYHFVALFYLASGCILLASPRIIEKRIPKLFPFLDARHLHRIWNSINLIIVGIILLIVGRWLVEENIVGLFAALLLSAWEVYLSVAFYWKRNEKISAINHFVLHTLIVAFVSYTIIAVNPTNPKTLKQSLASAFSVYSTNN